MDVWRRYYHVLCMIQVMNALSQIVPEYAPHPLSCDNFCSAQLLLTAFAQ